MSSISLLYYHYYDDDVGVVKRCAAEQRTKEYKNMMSTRSTGKYLYYSSVKGEKLPRSPLIYIKYCT